MCLKLLIELLHKKPNSQYEPVPEPNPVTIPHPEEKPDYTNTASSISVDGVFQLWYDNYGVPQQYWGYWRNAIDVQVYDSYPKWLLNMGVSSTAAGVSWEADGKRHYACLATWFNKGVTAHEQAHNSYALLTDSEKAEFDVISLFLMQTNELIKLIFKTNSYGLSSAVERHAEIYRYAGSSMPEELKRFYPKLFDGGKE